MYTVNSRSRDRADDSVAQLNEIKSNILSHLHEQRTNKRSILYPDQLASMLLLPIRPDSSKANALNRMHNDRSKPSKKEYSAYVATLGLVEDFTQRVNNSINALLDGGLMSQGATVNSTMSSLRRVVEEAVEEHRYENTDKYTLYGDTDVMQGLLQQLRIRLVSILLPVYRTLTQSMVQGSLSAFDRQVSRLKNAAMLPTQMNMLSTAVMQGFNQGADAICTQFLQLIDESVTYNINTDNKSLKTLPSAITSSNRSGSTPVAASKTKTLMQFDITFEQQCLREYLSQRAQDTISTLTLSGAYNPYIRETSLPPVHINMNYLFEPKNLLGGRELVGLYDEHKPGPAPTRADPLEFPGVATIPFSPTEHPVSSERAIRWMDVVKDFFTN